MKTMDELLAKLKQDGHIVATQRGQLEAYRDAIKKSNDPVLGHLHRETARHLQSIRYNELSGALWMLYSLEIIDENEIRAILINLGKEGQADEDHGRASVKA